MILMNDFKAEPEELKHSVIEAAGRVINSGWYILGKELEAFETEWARVCETKYAVGVGNGLDAIEISLRTLGIGRGDEVITTPMTAFATVLAIIRAGATPVLADIEAGTALLSEDSVQRCISPKTKAVVLVHLYGQLRNMDKWLTLCRRNNLFLIEDCAQSHMAVSGGKYAGSFGILGAFSFYPTKNLGAPGDAGAITTNEEDLWEKCARLRNYGQSKRYYHPEIGLNSRLDELQAAILTERLKWLPEFNKARKNIAAAYQAGISNPLIQLMFLPEENGSHVYHLFVIRSKERDKLQGHLSEKGIQSLIHYPVPVHLQQPMSDVKRDPLGLEACEAHAATCLSVPCHPQMTGDDIGKVIDAINSFAI